MFRIWLWRFVLITIAIVMTVGFYRMSYEAFRGLFTGQILDYSTTFSYPEPRASVEELGENGISIFATLLPYATDVENPASPDSLFIRVTGGSDRCKTSFLEAPPAMLAQHVSLRVAPDEALRNDILQRPPEPMYCGTDDNLSRDEDRINGYPFLQAFVQKSPELMIEYLHQEGDQFTLFARQSLDELNLKTAAPELVATAEESLPPQPLTLFQWAAIGVLIVLGAVYVWVRIGLLHEGHEEKQL